MRHEEEGREEREKTSFLMQSQSSKISCRVSGKKKKKGLHAGILLGQQAFPFASCSM